MKTIELTDKEYQDLLWFKNFVTMKLRGITNEEVVKAINTNSHGISHMDVKLKDKLMYEKDFEPDFTFGQCIEDIINSVMDEQKTGKVNYIT